MSSPSRNRIAMAAAALLALPACDREERNPRGEIVAETAPTRNDPRAAEYEGNAFQISQGGQYFIWMNCNGCHANGGGGMGPPLMDSNWRYGGSMEQIVATILEGRPNGMPSFKGRVTEQQAWQLAAFVRALSAQPRQDALGGRLDAMSSREPFTTSEREPQHDVTPQTDRPSAR